MHRSAVIVLLLIVVISGCVSNETPRNVGSDTPSPTASATETVVTPGPQIAQGTQSLLDLKVGETAATSDLAATVRSVNVSDSYLYYGSFSQDYYVKFADPGMVFILADVEVKNTGSSTKFVGSSKFSVEDNSGEVYSPEFYLGNDRMDAFKQLLPNQKTSGKVLYSLPTSSNDLRLLFDFGDAFAEPKVASWKIA